MDRISNFRRALFEEYRMNLGPDFERPGKCKMYGDQPWADLYNFLAELHTENYLGQPNEN